MKDNINDDKNHNSDTAYGFYTHQDVCLAITHGQDSHLCTAGELTRLSTFQALTLQAQQLYTKLLSRESCIIRVDVLRQNIKIETSSITELLLQNFLVELQPFSSYLHLSHYSKFELYELCKVSNIKKSGNKDALIGRLIEISARPPTLYKVCYRALFSRIFRGLYLQHTTKWSQPIIMRIQKHNLYPYLLTPKAIHPTRASYREYRLYYNLYREHKTYFPFPIPSREHTTPYRFQGYRFYRKYLMAVAAHHEKTVPKLSHTIYKQLQPHFPSLLRMLVLYKSHQHSQTLYETAKEYISRASLEEAITLYQSLSPLCSAKKFRKGLPPIYKEPNIRTLIVRPTARGPMFAIDDQTLTIEPFIIQILKNQGHQAFFVENFFWKTLKTFLFLPVFYTHSTAQFPSPFQYAPIDILDPKFYYRREKECNKILDYIALGHAKDIFFKNLPKDDVYILGQQYHEINTEVYTLFFEHIEATALVEIMLYLLLHPHINGMPDILMFSTHTSRCPILTPKSISTSMMFIEAKSQSDTIRPNQKAMHHLLLSHGIPVEIWKQKQP